MSWAIVFMRFICSSSLRLPGPPWQGAPQLKRVVSQFWRGEVWNCSGGRTILPLKTGGDPPLFPPSCGWFSGNHRHSLAWKHITPTLHVHMAFSAWLCLHLDNLGCNRTTFCLLFPSSVENWYEFMQSTCFADVRYRQKQKQKNQLKSDFKTPRLRKQWFSEAVTLRVITLVHPNCRST